MNDVSTMVFTKERCNNSDELLWNSVAEAIKLLIRQEYTVVVRDDDTDIIVLEYEHDERKDYWGCKNPCWIYDDEMEIIEEGRKEKEQSQ